MKKIFFALFLMFFLSSCNGTNNVVPAVAEERTTVLPTETSGKVSEICMYFNAEMMKYAEEKFFNYEQTSLLTECGINLEKYVIEYDGKLPDTSTRGGEISISHEASSFVVKKLYESKVLTCNSSNKGQIIEILKNNIAAVRDGQK